MPNGDFGPTRRPVLDMTGYTPPTKRVYDPCARCQGTDHELCWTVADMFVIYRDEHGEYHRRIPKT